jgi:hypothetical protein
VLPHADTASIHNCGSGCVCFDSVHAAVLEDREPEWVGRVRDERHWRAGTLVASRGRYSRTEVFPQGGRGRTHGQGSRGGRAGVVAAQRPRVRGGTDRRRARLAASLQPSRGLLDVLGLEGRLLHKRSRRRTARSGSTPACTGPMASKAHRKGTTSSTRRRRR